MNAMKNKILWLILGIVIGIIITVLVCWLLCCGKSGCTWTSKEKAAKTAMVSPTDITSITTDTANVWFNRYMRNPDSVILKGFKINVVQLRIMNDLLDADRTIVGFRIYSGIKADNSKVGMVVGVNEAEQDIVTTIYSSDIDRYGPCPPVCDVQSPITKPID